MSLLTTLVVLVLLASARPVQNDIPDCTLNPIRDTRCLPEVLPIDSNVFIHQGGERVAGRIWGYYLSPETLTLQTIVLLDSTSIPTGVFVDPNLVYVE